MSLDFEHAIREFLKSALLEAIRENPDLLATRRSESSGEDSPAEQMLLRTSEAAEQLAISESQLYKLTKAGDIPCVRVGRLVRYSSVALQEWIAESATTEAAPRKPRATQPAPRPARKRTDPSPARKKATASKPGPAAKKPASPTDSTRKSVKPRRPRKAEAQPEPPHRSRFARLAVELGIDPESLPPMTNGDIQRIAEVDIPTMHGWLYLNRGLPEDALAKLRDYVIANGKPKV